MKREIPLLITAIFGFFMIFQLFIPLKIVQDISGELQSWAIIVIAFSYVLGVANIIRLNGDVISRKSADWQYKIVMIVALFAMLLSGLIFGKEPGENFPLFNFMFESMFVPMQSTMFALLAFFIASAAFRAFRARTVEATLLLITATIVMIGRVSIGEALSSALGFIDLSEITEWIMQFPNNAGKRGIKIGAALGAISIGLKVLLGIEKSYLGGE